ncbi:MAG: BlaI/MecI/CopY family transcriptional regulator [Planctomycetota bacterium]
MPKKPAKLALSSVQLAVMKVLWTRGEAATSAVAAELAEARGLAPTTVATLLERLEARGAVTHRRDGRLRIYRARISEAQARNTLVANLLANVFSDDPTELLVHLLRQKDVSDADLARARARLEKEQP